MYVYNIINSSTHLYYTKQYGALFIVLWAKKHNMTLYRQIIMLILYYII